MANSNLPLGVSVHPQVEHVRVIEHRRSASDIDVVEVRLGEDPGCHVALVGPLETIAEVVAEAARGVAAIAAARQGPEGMAP